MTLSGHKLQKFVEVMMMAQQCCLVTALMHANCRHPLS